MEEPESEEKVARAETIEIKPANLRDQHRCSFAFCAHSSALSSLCSNLPLRASGCADAQKEEKVHRRGPGRCHNATLDGDSQASISSPASILNSESAQRSTATTSHNESAHRTSVDRTDEVEEDEKALLDEDDDTCVPSSQQQQRFLAALSSAGADSNSNCAVPFADEAETDDAETDDITGSWHTLGVLCTVPICFLEPESHSPKRKDFFSKNTTVHS